MSQVAAFLKDARAKAIEHAFAFLKTGGEYALAYLKTMDRSEAIAFGVAAVSLVFLWIALT